MYSYSIYRPTKCFFQAQLRLLSIYDIVVRFTTLAETSAPPSSPSQRPTMATSPSRASCERRIASQACGSSERVISA
eukprot:scaffold203280_cov26-Prasinocladus_malaysianus.AAC.1